MTHTLHRRGSVESLREDFVLLSMGAKGINLDGTEEKLSQMWEVISHYRSDIVNFGNITDGNCQRTDLEALQKAKNRIIHAVFKDRNTLQTCLKELKDRNLGVSVVVSGLYDEVSELCSEIGLSPHTVEYSLGIHGNIDKLPGEKVLEIITMCGHAMVAPNLVNHMVNEIDAGKMTCDEAAKGLCRSCDCGIFNPYRAAKLLEALASETQVEPDA